MFRLVVVISMVMSVIFMGLIILLESPLVRTSAGLGRLVVSHYSESKRAYVVDVIDLDQNKTFSVEREIYSDGVQAIIDDEYIFSARCFGYNALNTCSASISGLFTSNQINQLQYIKRFWEPDYSTPVLSPDGTQIAFDVISQKTQDSFISTHDVYIANNDGTNQLNLTADKDFDGGYMIWSPDSKRIAFGCSDNKRLCIAATDQRLFQNLDVSQDNLLFPIDWSPDGHQIMFQTITKDHLHSELYVVKVDGSDISRLLAISSP